MQDWYDHTTAHKLNFSSVCVQMSSFVDILIRITSPTNWVAYRMIEHSCVNRRELNTWWFHLHRALAVLGLILAIVGAALGGNLEYDDYRPNNGGGAHKALGILAVVATALQVTHTDTHLSTPEKG